MHQKSYIRIHVSFRFNVHVKKFRGSQNKISTIPIGGRMKNSSLVYTELGFRKHASLRGRVGGKIGVSFFL
jgi:hypothetical protein